jgi:hypothetical protein
MTPKNPDLYKSESAFQIENIELFKGCVTVIEAEIADDGLRSQLQQSQIMAKDLLISVGLNESGYAVFKMAVGESWRHSLIVTDITLRDHPLKVGLKKIDERRLPKNNYKAIGSPAP